MLVIHSLIALDLAFYSCLLSRWGFGGRSGFLGIWAVFRLLFGQFVNFLTLKSVSPVIVLIFKKFILSFSVCLKISAKFLLFYYTTSWIFHSLNLTSQVAPKQSNIRSVSFSLKIQIETILVQCQLI